MTCPGFRNLLAVFEAHRRVAFPASRTAVVTWRRRWLRTFVSCLRLRQAIVARDLSPLWVGRQNRRAKTCVAAPGELPHRTREIPDSGDVRDDGGGGRAGVQTPPAAGVPVVAVHFRPALGAAEGTEARIGGHCDLLALHIRLFAHHALQGRQPPRDARYYSGSRMAPARRSRAEG